MSIYGRNRLNGIHPEVKEAANWALGWADYYRVPITVTSGYRSWTRQAELRRRYESGQSRYPANRPGDSSHNYGLSFDSTAPPWAQSWWNHVRSLAGFSVPANDEIHAEVPEWRSLI